MMNGLQDINNSLESFHQLPAKKRLDVIINHPTPLKFVREMPTPDLLLTIRELGGESCLELVEMMHPKQIQELLDLEIWSRDELNLPAAGHYFSLLFEADRDSAIAQIHNLDIELIGLMLKTAATIYDTSLGEEPIDYPDLYSRSPDQRFIVCFSDDESLRAIGHALHLFLEALYGRDMSFVLRLLESVRFELVSGLEEESLRWRNNRLLDQGVLLPEERLEYFSSVSMADIRKIAARRPVAPALHVDSLLPATLFPKDINHSFPFLKASLAQCPENVKEAFWQSLQSAVANMHASLSGDFGDRDAMINTSDYVKFLIELGIFQSCHGKLDEASLAISQFPTKFLIRLGRTVLTNLRKRVIAHASDSRLLFGENFCHADSPLREVASALTLVEPRYYEGLLSPKKLTLRYFLSLSELQATLEAVNELVFRAELSGALGLGFAAKDLGEELKHLSHTNILARSLVNAYQTGPDLLAQVSPQTIQELFSKESLPKAFEDFADAFFKKLADQLVPREQHDNQEILERAMNFKRVVLIQLTQNWQLALG